MQEMEAKILAEGQVLPGGVIKVGSFLNQQIDTDFLKRIGEEIADKFRDSNITKILTIESSGIAIATATGMALGVPVVFAKKHTTSNVDGFIYGTKVRSYTLNRDYHVVVSRDYIGEKDNLLLVDDFLAHGQAMKGLLNIAFQAGAHVKGIAVAIEKGFQGGGDQLRDEGYRVESLAIVDSIDDDEIYFRR